MTMVPQVDPDTPPSAKLPPGEWAKKNLFNSPVSTVISVLLGLIGLYIAYRLFRFVFITGQWEVLERNLENFMVGQFPREERWRIVTQVIMLAAVIGAMSGTAHAAAGHVAAETGEPVVKNGLRSNLSTYGSVLLWLAVVLLAFTRTIGPLLIVAAGTAAAAVAWFVCSKLTRPLVVLGWSLAAVLATASFQVLSGTGGLAWIFATMALAPAVAAGAGALLERAPSNAGLGLAVVGLGIGVLAVVVDFGLFGVASLLLGLLGVIVAMGGDRIDGGRIGAVMVLGLVARFALRAIDHGGLDWDIWGGIHLSILATVGGILLAFPLGLMLALGRRSDLPAIKVMSVGYIEFFRGVPFITLLLSATTFLGFFINTKELPSTMTRAMIAVTIFASAYIAEIVRGGLQAVPKGQIEAGQAMGLSRAKIMRLIVLPQALRAVIPAMVGQFISLFKDTSLFAIIGVPEFLSQNEIVHAQADFRGVAIGETLGFVAFGYWAFAYAMSRESQRLERRLAVGH